MLKSVNLKTKILASTIAASILPFMIVSIIGLYQAKKGLSQQAFNQLNAVRQIKKNQIIDYFQTIEDQILTFSENQMIVDAMAGFTTRFRQFESDIKQTAVPPDQMKKSVLSYYRNQFLAEYKKQNDGSTMDVSRIVDSLDANTLALQYYYISNNMHPLGSKHLLDSASDGSPYSLLHNAIHPIVRNYLEKFGYYDIFLLDPDSGKIIYSVFKELDFATSLKDGPYSDTNFADVFRKAAAANDKDTVFLADYKKYPPSYEAPASFIGSPIFKGGNRIGVAIFQMPIDRINAMMAEREGLGETGETYLIGQDKLMRSDSYLDPEHHSVTASFKNPGKGFVDTAASVKALNGQSGNEIIIDYNGNPVLSSYSPVELGGVKWAILSEIDEAEAFKTISGLQKTIMVMAVIVTAVMVGFSILFSKSITDPIKKCVSIADRMAKGDFSNQLNNSSGDETGLLSKSLNNISDNLGSLLGELQDNSSTLLGSSKEYRSASETINNEAELVKENAENVGLSSEEMIQKMTDVSTAVDQAKENIAMIASATEEMNITLNEIASNSESTRVITDKSVQQSKEVLEKINMLGDAASAIGVVTDTINEISEQTNLLALNATIEAARAGEAGKGFAVVAGEIKELANQTASATLKIRDKIKYMQTSTDETVVEIEQIANVINDINENVVGIANAIEEQTATTNEISQSTAHAASGMEDISEKVTHTSAMSQKVTDDIELVGQSSRKLLEKGAVLFQGAESLNTLSQTINGMTSKFVLNNRSQQK